MNEESQTKRSFPGVSTVIYLFHSSRRTRGGGDPDAETEYVDKSDEQGFVLIQTNEDGRQFTAQRDDAIAKRDISDQAIRIEYEPLHGCHAQLTRSIEGTATELGGEKRDGFG